MKLRMLIFLFLTVAFGSSVLAQADPTGFLMIEKINDDYSVGYKSVDEEFGGHGDMWIISKNDTLPISEVEANICTFSSVSPNGIFATFETISMGWVYRSETDSILHDRWSGVIVELSSAKVVKYFRDDYGDSWNSHNLWLQGSAIVFDGNDASKRLGVTVYQKDEESSDVAWITYFETGEVKETGQTSDVFGCGMNVGTHNFYNKDGALLKAVWYDNWLPQNMSGCHEVVQDIHILEYSGAYFHLKSRKMFQSIYEGEESKTGIWQEFDEQEKIISSIDHGLVFDPLKLKAETVDIWCPEISVIQISNFTDTLLFTKGIRGWESESVSAVNTEALESFISRIERHRLEPTDRSYANNILGELRFIASGKERVYKLINQPNHMFDVVLFEGSYYKITKRGLLGVLIAPFVLDVDKWNWESPFLSSELTQISAVKFQSDEFENYESSSDEYIRGFLKLKWNKHIDKPSRSKIGTSLGVLTVKHENGIRSYNFYQKRNEESEQAFDADYFYVEIGGDWFRGSYYRFYQFFLYQK